MDGFRDLGCRSGGRPVAVVVPGGAAGGLLRLLPRLEHHELAHHPLVLVQEEVAVEHVRVPRIGVVLEGEQQPVGALRLQVHGVLAAGELRW
jgi:hypothetical protein